MNTGNLVGSNQLLILIGFRFVIMVMVMCGLRWKPGADIDSFTLYPREHLPYNCAALPLPCTHTHAHIHTHTIVSNNLAHPLISIAALGSDACYGAVDSSIARANGDCGLRPYLVVALLFVAEILSNEFRRAKSFRHSSWL
jgi:hypothetical protein